jgi:hypothetical protein
MRAQLRASKAQVGGGNGLELVVVEGRVRPRPGCGWVGERGARD